MRTHRAFIVPASLFSIFALTIIACKTSPPSAPVDTAPTAAITSHRTGDIIYGVDTIVVAATDDRGVKRVEMYVNNQLAATDSSAPWQFIWNTELWNDGNYSLQAKAYDEPGHVTASTVVTVTIRNAAPTASITSPVSNEICSGTDTIFVSAEGANTLTKVELYMNGSLAATDNAAPWRFIWNTLSWDDGSYTLQAASYDVANHYGLSNTVTAIVCNNPPTVTITSPSSGATVSGTTTVQVSAVSAITVTKVELYVDGTLLSTDYSSPWSFDWNTQQVGAGSHNLQAKAYDAVGHVGTSSSVTVTVSNAAPFYAKFVNTAYTPMSITVQGVTRTVQPGDSTTYNFSTNPQSLVYDASTSGKTSGGTTVGLVLTWGGSGSPINVSSYASVRLSLQVSSTYFFMYMSSTGATLGPVYVNYGLSDQTVDNISIPNNGVKYSIGYYKAHSGAIVRAYKYPSTTSYVYWTLSFPFNVNQSLYLTNSLSKIATGASELQMEAGEIPQSSSAFGDQKNNRTLGPNTITVFQNE
jgi:hypothetical protein